MRKILIGFTVLVSMIIVGFSFAAYGNEKAGSLDHKRITQQTNIPANIIKKTNITIPNYALDSKKNAAGFFDATIYTFNDITLFSYFDGTEITITDSLGLEVASVSIAANQQSTTTLSSGIYHLSGNQAYTTLVGDAISSGVQGFYAVDQSGRGLSTLLNTFMVHSVFSAEKFIVFGYSDNTSITIKNLETDEVILATIINRGEHFEFPSVPFGTFLQVSSDKPVSALSYGDQDYYVPSDNGTFAGESFFGYSAYVGNWTNSVTITAYNGGTTGTIVNSDTGVEIASFSLSEGQVYSHPITEPTYWTVEATKKVTVSNIPFSGWTGDYFYMTRAIDESGFGVGSLFYLATIASRVDVFSFSDSNQVRITQLGEYQNFPYDSSFTVDIDDKLADADGYFSLASNEVATFTSSTGRYVYKIEATAPVSVLQSNGGAGSDFMPLNFALELPDLATSSEKITFLPQADSYAEGDEIEISIFLDNVGYKAASNIDIFVYDGKPGEGVVPILSKLSVESIDVAETKSMSFKHRVPSDPNYRSLFVSIDPNGEIIESNPTNNLIEKSLVLREDLQLPLTVNIDAPGGLELDGDTVTSQAFTVHMDLFNLGDTSAENLVVTLQLLDGLTLLDGEQSSVALAELPTNDKFAANWQVLADASVTGPNRYEILVESNDVNKVIRRLVNVPDTAPPSIPTAVAANENSDGSIAMNWQSGNERDLIGFILFQKNGTQFDELATISGAMVSSYGITSPDSSISVYGISSVDSSNNTSDIAEVTLNKVVAPTSPHSDSSGGGTLFWMLLFLTGSYLLKQHNRKRAING